MEECRHIRVNGTKCQSAALRNEAWCYFHNDVYRRHSEQFARIHLKPLVKQQLPPKQQPSTALTTQSLTESYDYGYIPAIMEPVASTIKPAPAADPLELPEIEDISSIQLAISRIVQALAANTLDFKRAGLLLYALQIAAQHQPRNTPTVYNTVIDVGQTDDGIDVALASPGETARESFHQMAARLRLNLHLLDEIESEPTATSARAASRKSARAT